MKLSILDHSPIRHGGTAEQALQETLSVAQIAEALGYHRFWVAEHHGISWVAGSAPEVLIAAIGAVTKQIRIGSGGVMLPHYSAYKVAETFAVLATLYPGRVDLGVGRAPGSDKETARLLADGRPKLKKFAQLVQELEEMLTENRANVIPQPATPPPIWILGSSPSSAALAGRLGRPYNFALFINNKAKPEIFDIYRREFKPSAHLAKPYACLTVNVICAESTRDAQQLALSRNLSHVLLRTGQQVPGIPSVADAKKHAYTPEQLALMTDQLHNAAIGNPEQVKQKLEQLAADFYADELMTVTITYDFTARIRSYQLLADQFNLCR